MDQELVVTGIGMVSPVGYNAAQTCAALRAGITVFTELQGISDALGNPVVVATLPHLEPERASADRFTGSVWRATIEALDSAPPEAGSPLFVAIVTAETDRPGDQLDVEWLQTALQERWGGNHEIRHRIYAFGNAGAAATINDLSRQLAQHQGSLAVVIAADSLVAVPTLAYLERAGRLKSLSRPRGVIAGEAAVALAIESAVDAKRQDRKPYCSIAGVGVAREPVPVGRDEPCLGEGLTAALVAALESAGWQARDVKQVYCDLNGEEYRAHEWMLAMCRTLPESSVIHPADCIGDVGAASLPLLIGMAGMALRRGYARAETALTWASSDFGARGAVCVAAV